ncbi:MAG TPA: flagellar protein FlbB [Xanthobacteraceae bacterium]
MIRFVRDLRLIPIALLASVCLLVIKLADLALDGSRWISGGAPVNAEGVVRHASDLPNGAGGTQSWAQQMFNFPVNGETGQSGEAPRGDLPIPRSELAGINRGDGEGDTTDVTGSIAAEPAAAAGAKPPPAKPGAEKPGPKDPPKAPDGIVIPIDGAKLPSGAEREILQRLQQRREELDKRARELDIRENLVKAAEQRITAHLSEIKEVEGRIKTETVQKDQAEAGRFKSLVTMYESMKARDAAKIFDGLDMDVLIKVASSMNPRTMADVMAQMTPNIAQRLTVALASKAQAVAKNDGPAELPKIEGTPTMP